jgi:hypothetical protein
MGDQSPSQGCRKMGQGGCGEICSGNEDQALNHWNNLNGYVQPRESKSNQKASIKRMRIIRPPEIADSRLSQN